MQDWIERLDSANWLQEGTCAAYMRMATLAVAHSHAAHIYHRDLRPSNLLLTSKLPNAMVKVADFGLAAVLDPDNTISQPTPYTAPDLGGKPLTSAADVYSLGAIAHELLVGSPPNNESSGRWGSVWGFRGLPLADEEDAWSERSEMARDFVRRCLRRTGERPTAAKLLQHPWLSGLTPLSGDRFLADNPAAKETRRKFLCYTLGVLLLPVVVPSGDFDDLAGLFARADSDGDGYLQRHVAQRLLLGRCSHTEAVVPALDIVDLRRSDVIDLCMLSVADLVVREFFASGPTSAPLRPPFTAPDLADRMVARFFQVFADSGRGPNEIPTTSAATVRAKLRTATARSLEARTSVRYDELVAYFPEATPVDGSLLSTLVYASGGVGTPLCCEGDMSPLPSEPSPVAAGSLPSLLTSTASAFGLSGFLPAGLFQSCSTSAKRERSPCSIRMF